MQGKTKEVKRLIKLLTINLTPVFLNIAQNEVIKYQFHANTIELAAKNIKTFLKCKHKGNF